MLGCLSMIESEENQSKFQQIYAAYKDLALYYANHILGDLRDSEDVVHDSFCKLIKILDKISDPVCPKTRALIVTIVERGAIDLYRHRKRIPMFVMDEQLFSIPGAEQMDALNTKLDLASAMAALPPKYREVLLLRYDSGFTIEEIAQLLSMSQESVRKTIQRAKKKLEILLEEQGVYV